MSMREFVLEGVIPLFGMLMSFVMVGLLIVTISRARQRRLEAQTQIQSKLIDKFNSPAELAAFLQSDTGRQFMNGVQTAGQRHVHDRALSAVRGGITFSALGLGFLTLWPLTNTPGLVWPGVLLLVIGIAYFGTAYSMMRFASLRDASLAKPPLPPPGPTAEV